MQRTRIKTLGLILVVATTTYAPVAHGQEASTSGFHSVSRFAVGIDGASNSVAGNGRASAVTRDGSGGNVFLNVTYTHSSRWTLGVQVKGGMWSDRLNDNDANISSTITNSATMGLLGYGGERFLLWTGAGLARVKGHQTSEPIAASEDEESDADASEGIPYYFAGKAHIYEVGAMLTLLRGDHWGLDLTGRYEMLALPDFPAAGGREATFMGRATAGLQVSKTLVRANSSGSLMDYFLPPTQAWFTHPTGAATLTVCGNAISLAANVVDGAIGSVMDLAL